MQVLFGLSAFRLSAGDIAAYGVLPLPHGGIRLSRRISDLRFGGRSARRPVRHCPPDFRGALRGGRYLRLSERRCAFLHYYSYKSCVTAGRLCLRVCAFAAVCGISSVRGFFIYHGLAADSGENAGFTPESFFSPRGRTRALRSACLPKKFFCGCALSGEGAFPTDFSFGISG